MLTILTVIASAIGGALAFRLRGDSLFDQWTGTGTTGGRAFFALVMAVIAILASWSAGSLDWRLFLLAPAFFLGCIVGWPTGTESGQAAWWRVMARGVLWVTPAVLVLAALAYLDGGPVPWASAWLFLAGVLCPGALALGRFLPSTWSFIEPGHEAGEFLFGACLGAGLALAVLT